MILRVVFSVFFYVFILVLTGGCQPGNMSEVELKAYLRDKDNGLVKNVVNGVAAIEVLYMPNQLVHSYLAESNSNTLFYDSVDYFVAAFDSKNRISPDQMDIYASQLIIGKDTSDVVDAMIIPGANTVSHNFSIMYAFKSSLLTRASSENVTLFIDRNYADTRVDFTMKDIQAVRDIQIH